MLCDTSAIYFPIKYLKDILPRDVFAWSPTSRPMTRVIVNSDFKTIVIMDMDSHECFEPKEEDLEKQVYMLKAIVKISMLDKKQKG